jgi:addiction module HigA family antidote
MAAIFFPAIIEGDRVSGYSVFFPDLPGLASAGDTIQHAAEQAREGLELHIWGMREDGDDIPAPTPLEDIPVDPEEPEVARVLVPVSITSQLKRLTPKRITAHPGEIILEKFLKPFGISVKALAIALRVPATRIGAIVKGERGVSADTAMRLARYFGTTPEFWMNLQAMHDLTRAKAESGDRIERDVSPRAVS